MKKLTRKVCADILDSCYMANEHPHPMGLGLRQAKEYLLRQDYVMEPLKAVSNKGLSRLNLETAIEESLNRSKEV